MTMICRSFIALSILVLSAMGVGAEVAAPRSHAPSWCEIPRLGEAERPGPLTNFDDPELDDWAEYEGSEPEWE